MKRVLVLGINYAPEEIGIAVYTTGLCEALAARDIDVEVVTTWPYYPRWHADRPAWRLYGAETRNGVRVLRCPIYVPRAPSGAKRLLHHLSFACSVIVPLTVKAMRRRPDLVLCIAPSLVAAPAAAIVARLSGAQSWLHVQDFELEAALATGLIGKRSRATRMLRRIEERIYAGFTRLSSISREMCARLSAHGDVVEVRNWADDDIAPLAETSSYRARWGIATSHVALYSGNIALKQGIELILEAAALLAHRTDLTFVICGNGPTRQRVDELADALPNVRVFDLQPKADLNELLAMATVHLLPQRAEAAGLVLPSKLTNMLASGRPVIGTAAPDTDLAHEIDGCGQVTPPGDAVAFAAAIERLLDDAALRGRQGEAALSRAREIWGKKAVVDRFVQAAGLDPLPHALR